MQAIEFATTISMQSGIALPVSFKALYGREAQMILLLDDLLGAVPLVSKRALPQNSLHQALADVAKTGIFANIDDASDWQHEVRSERAQFPPASIQQYSL